MTTVARALIDVTPGLTRDDLAFACHQAAVKHKTTPGHVRVALARQPNAPGAGNLKAILFGDFPLTLSALEKRFIQLVSDARLPLPVTNKNTDSRYIDCRWLDHALTVELDSYTFHSSRHAWELDRRREREARARGDDFRRFTYDDVFERPVATIAELERALARHAADARSQARGARVASRITSSRPRARADRRSSSPSRP